MLTNAQKSVLKYMDSMNTNCLFDSEYGWTWKEDIRNDNGLAYVFYLRYVREN